MAEEPRLSESVQESDADSAEYTKQRLQAAQEHFEAMRENDRRQFEFLGEPEPELDIPAPEDRPLDTESMRDAEVAALERQNEVASEGYTPKGFSDFKSEIVDAPDVNEEAKEFQLDPDNAPDEFTGPEAADTASATGFNPRTVATSTDPDGLVSVGAEPVEESEERVEEITGESADSIREEQGGNPDGETVEPTDDEAVSKSSPEDKPNRIEK